MSFDLRTTEVLKDLIEVLHDSEQNFRQAAERAESGDLKRMLLDFAAQRGRMAGELHAEIKRFGEPDPPDTGTLKGSLQRTLMGLRAALSADRDRTLLEECERGEDVVIGKYRGALENDLPFYTHELLGYQLEEIGILRTHLRNVEHGAFHAS